MHLHPSGAHHGGEKPALMSRQGLRGLNSPCRGLERVNEGLSHGVGIKMEDSTPFASLSSVSLCALMDPQEAVRGEKTCPGALYVT